MPPFFLVRHKVWVRGRITSYYQCAHNIFDLLTTRLRQLQNLLCFALSGETCGLIPASIYFKLSEVFDGECIRKNDETHLDGDISDDKVWQESYKKIISHPISQNYFPNGPVDKNFNRLLTDKFNSVMSRK